MADLIETESFYRREEGNNPKNHCLCKIFNNYKYLNKGDSSVFIIYIILFAIREKRNYVKILKQIIITSFLYLCCIAISKQTAPMTTLDAVWIWYFGCQLDLFLDTIWMQFS